tara:strand:- start:81988 stop:82617 length:630 start_codon:yes stop_codon:yes gene_type:complete
MDMSNYKDFEIEFIELFSEKEFKIIDKFITEKLEDFDTESEVIGDWSLSLDIEKINCLNHDYHFSFEKEGREEAVTISFKTGIDVGCELMEYSLTGDSGLSIQKTVEVFSHIEIDWSSVVNHYNIRSQVKAKDKSELPDLFVLKIENYLKNNKQSIEEKIRSKSYDDYVTGGGNVVCDKHYRSAFEEHKSKGFFWNEVYEETEVFRNLI